MAKPPETPPSSDIDGVNRDARVGTPAKDARPDPGAAIATGKDEGKARPEESAPPGS